MVKTTYLYFKYVPCQISTKIVTSLLLAPTLHGRNNKNRDGLGNLCMISRGIVLLGKRNGAMIRSKKQDNKSF